MNASNPATRHLALPAQSDSSPTLHLGTYRRAIMAVLADNVFTDAERLRTNHTVYECQDGAKLALWLTNVTRVREERETQPATTVAEAPVTQAACWATAAQCDEIFNLANLSCFTAGEKKAALQGLVSLTQLGAVHEIGRLYATAWRRGVLPLHPENGLVIPLAA